MNRRELLKLSLLTCGAALTSSAQGSGSPSPLLADGNASASPVLETSLGMGLSPWLTQTVKTLFAVR